MGRGVARLLVVGLVLLGATVLVAVMVADPATGSPARHATVVDGGVRADGTPAAMPPDWVVSHPSAGIYRLETHVSAVDVDVPRWDAAADVTVVPMGDGAVEVRFAAAGVALDSGFSFTALER